VAVDDEEHAQGPQHEVERHDREGLVDIMKRNVFEIFVDIGLGKSEWSMLTTDISFDYVKINAEYST